MIIISGIVTCLEEKDFKMRTQPVTNQPNFNGRVVFDKGIHNKLTESLPPQINTKIKEVANLIEKKPYDIFIFQNGQNPDFYDVAANKSLKKAKNVKEYTVKVQTDIMLASLVDAAKDAMDMYEKYIAKSIKR